MPVIHIRTNTHHNHQEIQSICQQASRLASEILGKPEHYVMALVECNQTLSLAGDDNPAAYLEIKCLGLDENRTDDFSRRICLFMYQSMGILPERCYIEFSSPHRHMWGWNNNTFAVKKSA
ncbi:MAG: phenylpyruvate tautomerase MIF-related protein [Gammaproteobacteria bacterium]|nr:phenylpyruvate tautomerase MIF-related protein [Gammaproteobacteria bacterium]